MQESAEALQSLAKIGGIVLFAAAAAASYGVARITTATLAGVATYATLHKEYSGSDSARRREIAAKKFANKDLPFNMRTARKIYELNLA